MAIAAANGQIQGVARDDLGNALPGASVYVYVADTTTLHAPIYTDRMTQSIVLNGNPIIADENGYYKAGVKPGIYDIRIVSGTFDRTYSNTWVDQIDWPAFGRRGRLALEWEGPEAWTPAGTITKWVPTASFTQVTDKPTWDATVPDGLGPDFTWAGTNDSRITYTGTETRLVRIKMWSIWGFGAAAVEDTGFFWYIYKNGVSLPPSGNDRIGHGGTNTNLHLYSQESTNLSTMCDGLLDMDTNDYIEIFATGTSGTTPVETESVYFSVE
jgi:hypothetical protein